MSPIDQNYFNELADWAESEAPLRASGGRTPSDVEGRRETQELLRRAGATD